ncbi:MAG: putative lipid II flippase FtsW [Clostridia bacterium]|nr:putative lipid II flippase FtsW [Clostridia bacterium]
MASSAAKTMSKWQKFKALFYTKQGFDKPFLIVLLILLTIGLACMFSASYVNAYYYQDDSYFFINRQLIFALIGVGALLLLSAFDYHKFHALAIPLFAVSVVLLILVLILPSDDGVSRWLPLPLIGGFQPSEVAKFAVVVLFAHMVSLNYQKMDTFKGGYLPFMAVLAVVCGLTLLEPHLSGTMLVFALGFVMMYIGGTKPRWLFLTILLAVAVVVFMILVVGYEKDRIEVWLDLFNTYERNPDQAWQTMQSLYAIGSGGLMGQGFGNSRQKHLFLPEPQNDFIFAIVCEEMGFIGALIIIVLFAVLVWRGFVIAMHAPDKFGFMLAIGLTAQIGIQVAINIAVVSNLLPNTGISLPFFSYGGSSLVMLLAQMGIILAVSRRRVTKTS